MGSARRRRSVSLTLTTLVFFILFFVAGASVKLHHTAAPAAGDENASLLARKILRVKTLHTGESNVNMLRQDDGRQSQSSTSTAAPAPASSVDVDGSSSRPLPAGIVHGTSNLEMVSMVGNPEEHPSLSSKPKSLLAVPVGIKNKAAVEKLLAKFPAAHFAVILFHYDGAVQQWADLGREVVHVAASGQTKWWFAKRYDHVFLWDEDLDLHDTFDPLRYLDVVRRERLAVSQPALARGSEIHHAITARRTDGGEVHRHEGGWVEMMAPVFSRAAWRSTPRSSGTARVATGRSTSASSTASTSSTGGFPCSLVVGGTRSYAEMEVFDRR
uniref:Uncharacterized protein n=1 Tax=Leersia perrieri TaxID=77586 RepID=A0A0D9WYD1_9ORYZ